MRYRLTFYGRQKGALGLTHLCSAEVEADTLEAAQLKLYDSHEHITITRVEPQERVKLQLHCRQGIQLTGDAWETVFRWVTWSEYESEDEARTIGQSMVAGSPRDCRAFRIVPAVQPITYREES